MEVSHSSLRQFVSLIDHWTNYSSFDRENRTILSLVFWRFWIFWMDAALFFQLAEELTRDFILEGWLKKMGPRNEPFKKRFFTLDKRKLMYLEEPLVNVTCTQIYMYIWTHLSWRRIGPFTSPLQLSLFGHSGCISLWLKQEILSFHFDGSSPGFFWTASLSFTIRCPWYSYFCVPVVVHSLPTISTILEYFTLVRYFENCYEISST